MAQEQKKPTEMETPEAQNAVPPKKPASAGKSPAKTKKQPSKFGRFMRKLLRAIVTAVLLFGAGVLVSYYFIQAPRVKDLNSQVDQLQTENLDLQDQVMEFQAEVADLSPLADENQSLRESLTDEMLHVQILSALKDVQSAQVSLADSQLDAARLALTRTDSKLEDLRSMLSTDNEGVVDGMVQRLDLAFEGLDGDPVAAAADLSVLANNLVTLENTLFSEP